MIANVTREAATAIINALRAGTVPSEGLEHYAVGLDDQMSALREQRAFVSQGHGAYKFLRGSYGSGKTFLSSLAASEALADNFLVSKVVVSVSDTPLYKLSEVYRKLCQGLSLPGRRGGAVGALVDRWLYRLEDQVVEVDGIEEDDPEFSAAVGRKVDMALVRVGEQAGRLAACLRAYHEAKLEGSFGDARGLLDWMSGEPKVGAEVKRLAAVTGQLDSTDALVFLRGWLELLQGAGYSGMLVILDEVETVLRLRRPERLKSLEVLRQLVDAVDHQQFPGLHLLVTGTPDFFESATGVPALEPLHERITLTHREGQPVNLRQPQITLPPFDCSRLLEVGLRIRALYPAADPARLSSAVSERFIGRLVDQMTAGFGGRVEVVPRLFLREFVHLLDLVDQHPEYQPESDYHFDGASLAELSPEEESALGRSAREVMI